MSDDNGNTQSREVTWPLDATTMYATLVRPGGRGPFPGVVMIAGSGPTDRDWTSPLIPGTNGSAPLLAEALAGHGFASIRYDKRASGPHVRETLPSLMGKMSFQAHLDELTCAVRALADEEFVDTTRFFALGNSEGNLHALNYQVHDPAIPFAGLVLTGAPGRAVGVVARMQIAAQVSALPNGAEIMAGYDAAIGRFLAGQPVDPDPTLPQPLIALIKNLEVPVNLPFARELWLADATVWLPQVRVPVLVVIGKKDIQVDWRADGDPLQRAAAGRDVTFLLPEDANHVLKHDPTPRAEINPVEAGNRYNASDAVLDPEALAGILGWLHAHA